MKPRVFISSTYYDLKYVRENLEKVLFNLNFEPVLFESNKVTFEHGKPLDVSCFNEVKTCHMMVLIIGGRYGAVISDPNSQVEKDIYDKEYISITRKEYETAIQHNIPIYIFIEKNVFSEYHTYKINRNFYVEAVRKNDFKFFFVESLNVFKFIDILSSKAIKSFEKNEEIEEYLKDQISGMFYLYLESLKSGSKQDQIYDTVSELKNIVKSMSQMVNAVGQSVITDPVSLEAVINKQLNILISYYTEKLYSDSDILVDKSGKYTSNVIKKIADVIYKKVLCSNALWEGLIQEESFDTVQSSLISTINDYLKDINPSISFKDFDFWLLDDFMERISPLLNSKESEAIFLRELKKTIKQLIDFELREM